MEVTFFPWYTTRTSSKLDRSILKRREEKVEWDSWMRLYEYM